MGGGGQDALTIKTEFHGVRIDRLHGLVVGVPDPEIRVRFSALPDFLERGPLSLVSTIEELLGRKMKRIRSRNPRTRP
jgi:hypothetical protein